MVTKRGVPALQPHRITAAESEEEEVTPGAEGRALAGPGQASASRLTQECPACSQHRGL